MTDKQIITEIDINKCKFCDSGEYCHIYSGTADFKWLCEENEDCQIKNLLLQLKAKEQECEKAKQNAQDTYDLWQALIESFNILQGEKIKLEQEIEELKEKCKKYGEINERETKDYAQLKKENEKYKPILDRLLKQFETYDKLKSLDVVTFAKQTFEQLDQLKAENIKFTLDTKKLIAQYSAKLERLEQTLTEIKEIAEKGFESSQLTKLILDLILQKISECEVENGYTTN